MRRLPYAVPVALLRALVTGPTVAATVTLPPTGTDWDHQRGGTRPVAARVGIVERDRRAKPVSGAYAICCVNGFQTRSNEKRFWTRRDARACAARACRNGSGRIAVVRRDVDLTAHGTHRRCA
jgi:hypothetical protein